MARHGIIVSRLNVIPNRHKKNRLFNHASRNGYKPESCDSVNPFLAVVRKADGGMNDHKAKYHQVVIVLD
ncbi:MAG: hypothetical protein WCF23_19265 [Candidatus Nitrosopolaris sp.]